jgi:hypothetical protein
LSLDSWSPVRPDNKPKLQVLKLQIYTFDDFKLTAELSGRADALLNDNLANSGH